MPNPSKVVKRVRFSHTAPSGCNGAGYEPDLAPVAGERYERFSRNGTENAGSNPVGGASHFSLVRDILWS